MEQRDNDRLATRRPLTPVTPGAGQTAADAELADLQARTIESARGEIGTREVGSSNRGARVDQYAQRSRMPVGGAWCGYFTGFNYSEAAREAGGEFSGINGFHSMQKARSFFEYRSYTDNRASTNASLDALREQHVAEGSARRWMTLAGSGGQRHAETHNRPHEVYEPQDLPIRAGDTALFSRGHVGLVESYDRATGQLTTIEGNTASGVTRRSYDLNDPRVRAGFEGFGRPARGDFTSPSTAPRTEAAPANDEAPAAETTAVEGAPATTETGAPTLDLPPRSASAETGSEFLARTANMTRAEREAAMLEQIEAGNVPSFSRELQPVEFEANGHTGTAYVMPDYLAIGSDEDFVRVPLNPVTAQRIADQTDASLPTTRIVDAVHRQADVRLTPNPLPAGPQMMSNAYVEHHDALVDGQLRRAGGEPGELVAGHKKDVVISNRLAAHPDRVAIYGWHQSNGRPIQPLSTVHEQTYGDYSHGARLVSQQVVVDGRAMRLEDVLRDPELAPLFSAEGAIRAPRAD